MRHRHLDTTAWTPAAIDSALEYGDLADWRELFAAARRDPALARTIAEVCRAHPIPGSAALALALVQRLAGGPGLRPGRATATAQRAVPPRSEPASGT